MIRNLLIIARLLLGAVFIFSGFVKGVDPMGSTYKFIDYFTAFGMPALSPLAFPLAVLLNAAEFTIGIALVLGARMKEASWSVLLFMVFFTILTFILALTNPVSDCGCFGDALKLTNWETFYKNIILMALAVVIFLNRNKYTPAYSAAAEWIWLAGSVVFIFGITVYSYRHLPILDFRPYKIGTDINQGMIIPEGMPTDKFRTILYYEKEGVVKEFTEENYPWDDSTWVWKDSKTELIEKGYEPPIHDFNIITPEGVDITDNILYHEGYTMLVVAHRLEKANKAALVKANELARYFHEKGYGFYCLTSSLVDEIETLREDWQLDFEFCHTDDITLKTIIRSNPGFVLLKEGTIIDKWHYNDMPEIKSLPDNLMSHSIRKLVDGNETNRVYILLFALVLYAFAFHQFRRYKE
ncbi:MAG: DoxX family protein [Bacteroidales bacterium]|jgi:uncharacterized membrane protein YphA (DoxX/SURF4 family)|nr:DoxX family protein [Bacteroidales bacterium]